MLIVLSLFHLYFTVHTRCVQRKLLKGIRYSVTGMITDSEKIKTETKTVQKNSSPKNESTPDADGDARQTKRNRRVRKRARLGGTAHAAGGKHHGTGIDAGEPFFIKAVILCKKIPPQKTKALPPPKKFPA